MPNTNEFIASLVESTNANTERIISSQEQLAINHNSHLDVIVKQLSAQFDQINHLIATLAIKSPDPNNSTPLANHNPSPPKISLPIFDGSNPLDWIFLAENYFNYYSIPADEWVALVVFYFTGDALSWYKHLSNNGLLGTWPEFSRALDLRFSPSAYENHEATLFKLRQTTNVAAYQTEFERVSNRVVGLSEQSLKNCFISGLKQEIQNELALHDPQTLHETYRLSKLTEHKLSTTQKSPLSPTTAPAPKLIVPTTVNTLLTPTQHGNYYCTRCRSPIGLRHDLLSKNFKANLGQGYMFGDVANVVLGEEKEKQLMTGRFLVADVNCSKCKEVLGWKYLKSFNDLQEYKLGKFIIEKAKLLKEYS